MDYQDLRIDLRSGTRGRFEASVAEAPLADNPRVTFKEPIAWDVLVEMHHAFDAPGVEIEERVKALPAPPRTLGRQVFSGVFKNRVKEVFRLSRQAVLAQGDGLRLRLRFAPRDPQAAYLAALPWEWLWDSEEETFLATNLQTPVIREIAAPTLRTRLDVELPLRILVVDAAPKTMHELNLKLETVRMAEALDPLIREGKVELVRLPKADKDLLRDALLDEGIHVLHFMGHGGYEQDSGTGAIFFERDDGGLDQVDGEMFAAYLKLRPESNLRLVVLNACKTARYAGRIGSRSRFSLPVAVLSRTGIPAVIANQYSISDSAAIDFSKWFYGGIAAGKSLEEAITEARLRLWSRTEEWGTSVLFLTAPDGRIFTVQPGPPKPVTVPVTKYRAEEAPVLLGVRSFAGHGGDMEGRNFKVLDFVPLFNERFIRDRAWWQERIFPDLSAFLQEWVDLRRPLVLDMAAHCSIAFAAGWLLEPKSGLDVTVPQRIGGAGTLPWHPNDGSEPAGALWQDRPEIVLDPEGPDLAVAISISQPDVAAHVQEFVRLKALPVGRILDATIHPEPGQTSVHGGAHCLRLAQALMPRLLTRYPHERSGHVHIFAAAPNAFTFYLGQLASSLGRIVLYEYAFKAEDNFGRYQRSIELPPPGEAPRIPDDW